MIVTTCVVIVVQGDDQFNPNALRYLHEIEDYYEGKLVALYAELFVDGESKGVVENLTYPTTLTADEILSEFVGKIKDLTRKPSVTWEIIDRYLPMDIPIVFIAPDGLAIEPDEIQQGV